MKWEKQGLIFNVDKNNSWMHTHASLPISLHLKDDIYRIIFSTRDINNKSQGAYIDIDIKRPDEVLGVSENPLLKYGALGFFDDSGAQPCCLLKLNGKDYLYYTGWSLSNTIPFRTYLGLSVYNAETNVYDRFSDVPVLDRTSDDKISIGWAFVLKHGSKLLMWYESNVKWEEIDNKKIPYFTIKYAESNDGITWERSNITCIEPQKDETIISRPCVLFENGIFKMWYAYKNDKYRIGYAESLNGKNWIRKDNEVGIDVSVSGWDSEEIEYPYVFDHKGDKYMLYNGNGFGKTGFGLAKLIMK